MALTERQGSGKVRKVRLGRCPLHPEVYCSEIPQDPGYYCFKCAANRVHAYSRFEVSTKTKAKVIFEQRKSAFEELHTNIKLKRASILAQLAEMKSKREALIIKLLDSSSNSLPI